MRDWTDPTAYYCNQCPDKDKCADAFNCMEGFYGICGNLYKDCKEKKEEKDHE